MSRNLTPKNVDEKAFEKTKISYNQPWISQKLIARHPDIRLKQFPDMSISCLNNSFLRLWLDLQNSCLLDIYKNCFASCLSSALETRLRLSLWKFFEPFLNGWWLFLPLAFQKDFFKKTVLEHNMFWRNWPSCYLLQRIRKDLCIFFVEDKNCQWLISVISSIHFL